MKSQNQSNNLTGEAEKVLRDFAIPTSMLSALPFFYFDIMKRFTETTKWSDPWYRKLSIKHKALWGYLCDNCDNAGVWKIDFELASFQIGEEVSKEDIENFNEDKERVVISKDAIIIKDFIAFQIGNLVGENLTNLQKSCLALVNAYAKKGIKLTGKLRVAKPIRTGIGIGKGKGKDKDKGISKDKKNHIVFKQPSLEEIRAYCKEHNYSLDTEKFFNHYETSNWYRGKTKIRNWKACVRTWVTSDNPLAKTRKKYV